MLFTWLYLTYLLKLAHGSNDGDDFIKDVLESSEVNQCDYGYVYEHGKEKIADTIIETLGRRYRCLT